MRKIIYLKDETVGLASQGRFTADARFYTGVTPTGVRFKIPADNIRVITEYSDNQIERFRAIWGDINDARKVF